MEFTCILLSRFFVFSCFVSKVPQDCDTKKFSESNPIKAIGVASNIKGLYECK